jgi:hypothetical protein
MSKALNMRLKKKLFYLLLILFTGFLVGNGFEGDEVKVREGWVEIHVSVHCPHECNKSTHGM